MARRLILSVLLPAILVCNILSQAKPATSPLVPPTRTDSTAPITVGHSVFPLYGPWKFQIGDSPVDSQTGHPLWAEPGFDDANWETVDLTPQSGVADPFTRDPRYVQGWTMKGHPGYWGYAWYRLQIPVTSVPGEKLALLTYGWIDDGYQFFDNGELLGSWGKFRGPGKWPVVYFTQPAMFVLPQPGTDAHGAGPATVLLAFRVWMSPVRLSHHPFTGGLHYAPVFGEAGAIAAQTHLAWLELARQHSWSAFLGALFLLLALVAASLTLFDRSDPVYLWVAGALLSGACFEAAFALSVLTQWESFRTFFLLIQVFIFPLLLGSWAMAWWVWFQLRRPVWMPKAIAGVTLLYMVCELLGEDLFYDLIPHPVGVAFRAASGVVRLLPLALMVFIVGKGIREQGWEGWLVLPAVVPLAFSEFQNELIILNMHGTLSVFGVVLFYSDIANLLMSAAIALLLLRRLLLSVRRQRQMALDVKQAQEVQRVILPQARLGLPELVIESEYRPALEVGGDFFQIIPYKTDGSLLIVAGDVAGKGLQAGMLVALSVGAIRTEAAHTSDPMQILRSLNLRLCGRGIATCLALRIASNGEATLANAGHIPPYLNSEPVAMEGALPLGMIEGAEFSVMHFRLKEADKLVLMSDGIAEATDADGHLFGFDRVHELLRTATTAAEVAAEAQSFGQEDDISVISVTRTALEPAA